MVNFKIKDFSDKVYHVEAYDGQNLMEAGIKFGVPFEQACGGNAECTTCHCYLPLEIRQHQQYIDAEEKELDALEFADGAMEESRLACQTKVIKDAFEGKTLEFAYALTGAK